VAVGRVIIVGVGPAGATLTFLLARRGIEVALLERQPDFERTFRGDGLQPSGIDAFGQMGFGAASLLPPSHEHCSPRPDPGRRPGRRRAGRRSGRAAAIF
jgi:2-polyprenyl-6-methoxyphenol hydroxylase-like FAD-dependent oxidoreductase